ncbi:hypothetical protein EC991_010057 [Linnemannia zychae]|nr:hypothetical protein EC991_010057 [Linnemannia zychae]
MLVMTLGLYILIISISRIHGYLAGDSADGRNESLVSTGRDIWSNAWVGKTGTVKNAGKGGMKAELDSDKTVTTKQKDGVRGQANDPTAPVADVQDQAAIIPPGPIWVRRAEDEMDDPLDYYPDEDEDDPLEAASFISWLAQASLTAPKAQQQQDQQDQQQQQRRPQQPEGYQEPPRRQSQIAQESLLEPERYFTYMPYAGISNQFYGMLRAMSIARALDRTLILPPITSSSHDKSRQNQAWSEFFDLDEFRRRTGLKVIEYQDLRDRGSFRGATGVQGSGSSVGASWIPPWTKESETTESKGRRKGRYQHSLGTGTAVVDMTMPCHVTCGFGSKRDLDFTAKAFVRQWGFQYKKQMLPKSQPPASAGLTNTVDTSPIDLTRDLDRIVAALQDDSLKSEGFLCVSNTYKIQVAPSAIPVNSLVDSIEWHEFGQHLLFQPKLTHFVEEFLDKTFGEHPEERTKYTNDTFWISTRAPSVPPPVSSPLPDPGPISLPPPAQVNPPLLEPLSQPSDVEVNTQSLPTQASAIPVSYAASVDLTPWPPLRPLIQHTFFMIHVRRGDFETYCRKEFKDERFDQCLPSNEAYARVMDELQHRALRERSERDGTTSEEKERPQKRGKIPVLVATNEHRPEELTRLRQLGRARVHNVVVEGEQAVAQGGGIGGGAASSIAEEEGEDWIILDHEEMRTVERLGVFGPMMVEQLLMAEAEALVGVKMSTFSRVGGYRQRDWYRRRILYM